MNSQRQVRNQKSTDNAAVSAPCAQSVHSAEQASCVPGHQRALGNHIVAQSAWPSCAVQRKMVVGTTQDKFEQEADHIADQIVGMSTPVPNNGDVSENAGPRIQRKTHTETQGLAPHLTPTIARFEHGGTPLAKTPRNYFEPRFSRDFSDVRIHTGDSADHAARSIQARAFTLGQNIVFARGEYNPASTQGKQLIAHELVHTVQQQTLGGAGTSRIFRQHHDEEEESSNFPPVINIPGTDFSLIPGPIAPFFGNQQLLLPSSLQLRHVPLTGTAPQFTLSLSPHRMMGMVLGNIDLYSWTRPGTPPHLANEPSAQAQIRLVNPSIHFNASTRELQGHATLSVGSDYPESLKAPTELDVEFSSTQLGQFTGSIGLGPLVANFNLRLHYDTTRLESAVAPVFAPAGGFDGFAQRLLSILRTTVPGFNRRSIPVAVESIWEALVNGNIDGRQFALRTLGLLGRSIPRTADLTAAQQALEALANELVHPGFSVDGSLRLFGIPLTGFLANAPTTVPLDRPLAGAPTAFPFRSFAGGVVLAPPGSITDVAVPALGLSASSFGERSGSSITAAFLPSISTEAISRGEPLVNQFPVFAFAEVSHVHRVSDGLDLGVRITAQLSTPEVFGPRNLELDPAAALTRSIQDHQEAQSGLPPLITPNLGITVFGEFSNF